MSRASLSMRLEIIERTPSGAARPTPLLFVHGGWHGAWCWEAFQSFFAQQGYASHAVNLRGHGASEGRNRLRRTSAAEYVADIRQAASTLSRPPVLIGHSMGGYLVQKYLEQHAAPAAVLLATMPSRCGVQIFNRMLCRRPLRTIRMHLTMSGSVQVETPELAREALFSPDISPEQVAGHFKALQEESYRIGWDMSFFDVPRPERVRKVPLLVLGALRDWIILPREIAATAKAYGTEAEFFEMAHDMMLESGWQDVSFRILGWLRENGL